MAQDRDQIVIAPDGDVYAAPVGTTAPAESSDAWPVGWENLGLISEDGVALQDSKTLESIMAWQLLQPARRVVTERDFQTVFALRQWSADTVVLAFGGGAVTEPDAVGAPGEYKYEPPDPEDLDERALGVEWADGTKNYRVLIPRGMVIENVESNLQRSSAADLPITFAVLAEPGVKPWYLLTNDPAFAPPA